MASLQTMFFWHLLHETTAASPAHDHNDALADVVAAATVSLFFVEMSTSAIGTRMDSRWMLFFFWMSKFHENNAGSSHRSYVPGAIPCRIDSLHFPNRLDVQLAPVIKWKIIWLGKKTKLNTKLVNETTSENIEPGF